MPRGLLVLGIATILVATCLISDVFASQSTMVSGLAANQVLKTYRLARSRGELPDIDAVTGTGIMLRLNESSTEFTIDISRTGGAPGTHATAAGYRDNDASEVLLPPLGSLIFLDKTLDSSQLEALLMALELAEKKPYTDRILRDQAASGHYVVIIEWWGSYIDVGMSHLSIGPGPQRLFRYDRSKRSMVELPIARVLPHGD